jgi:hypothetical protein
VELGIATLTLPVCLYASVVYIHSPPSGGDAEFRVAQRGTSTPLHAAITSSTARFICGKNAEKNSMLYAPYNTHTFPPPFVFHLYISLPTKKSLNNYLVAQYIET